MIMEQLIEVQMNDFISANEKLRKVYTRPDYSRYLKLNYQISKCTYNHVCDEFRN